MHYGCRVLGVTIDDNREREGIGNSSKNYSERLKQSHDCTCTCRLYVHCTCVYMACMLYEYIYHVHGTCSSLISDRFRVSKPSVAFFRYMYIYTKLEHRCLIQHLNCTQSMVKPEPEACLAFAVMSLHGTTSTPMRSKGPATGRGVSGGRGARQVK